MKRMLTWLIYVPVVFVAIVILLFAVANRQWVTLSLDPFNQAAPALTFSAPLFLLLFGVLILGVVLGGSASWIKQGRHRRAGREARIEVARHRAEVERLKALRDGNAPPGLPATARF
jgi:uncharacterized integral membrane protein